MKKHKEPKLTGNQVLQNRPGRPEMQKFESSKDPEITEKELALITPLEELEDPEDYARVAGIEVSDLDLHEIPNDATIVLSARRRRGKSTWIKQFCFVKRKDFPITIVFTKTKQNRWYQQFIPDHLVIDGYDQSVMRRILDFQYQRIVADPKLNNDLGAGGDPKLRILVIMDDIIGDRVHDDPVLQEVFALGRWYGLSLLISVQHMNALGPLLRGNADVAVFFRNSSRIVFDLIRENFMGQLTNREVAAIMNQYTKDYRAFIVGAWTPEERFYHFKARKDLPTFRMCKKFWKEESEMVTNNTQPTLWQNMSRMFSLKWDETNYTNSALANLLYAVVVGTPLYWFFMRSTVKPITYEQRPRGVPGG